jgi:hypothetical protein
VVGQEPEPAVYATEALPELNPFLFFDLAEIFNALPFLIDLIVQEVLVFAMVQDFPPAVTLLPVIFEPPFDVGKVMVTVTFTFPFLGAEEDMAETVGAEGFVTLACAGPKASPDIVSAKVVISVANRRIKSPSDFLAVRSPKPSCCEE